LERLVANGREIESINVMEKSSLEFYLRCLSDRCSVVFLQFFFQGLVELVWLF
jgi:hypothetical protein